MAYWLTAKDLYTHIRMSRVGALENYHSTDGKGLWAHHLSKYADGEALVIRNSNTNILIFK